jgi:hypothetical protein
MVQAQNMGRNRFSIASVAGMLHGSCSSANITTLHSSYSGHQRASVARYDACASFLSYFCQVSLECLLLIVMETVNSPLTTEGKLQRKRKCGLVYIIPMDALFLSFSVVSK